MVTNPKKEKAATQMEQYLELVRDNPLRAELEPTFKKFQEDAKIVNGYLKNVAAMTQKDWDQIDKIEDNLIGNLRATNDIRQILTKALKMAMPLAKKWKEEKNVQDTYAKIVKRVKDDNKVIDQILKVAPAIKKDIDTLAKQRT